MTDIQIIRDDQTVDEGWVIDSAMLEMDGKALGKLWFRIPEEQLMSLPENLDHFVLGSLFQAMAEGANIKVRGPVSPSLLRNLEEFTAAWAHWLPGRYRNIEIEAGKEMEPPATGRSGAVAAFSGGVDAAFTVYRHNKGLAGRLSRKITAGMLVHGFDIPFKDSAIFEDAFNDAKAMLTSLDLELIPVATNFREINQGFWTETHGAGVAACLYLLQGRFDAGLIGSTEPYKALVLPWGSNPVTDPLLGSDSFKIIHDGASFTRTEKITVIKDWPEALKYLRVCWQDNMGAKNCGACEKCIRTILNFRLHNSDLPQCFEKDVTDREIAGIRGLNPVPLAYLREIVDSAKENGINDNWVKVLEKTVAVNEKSLKGWRKNWSDTRNRLALGTRFKRLLSGK